MEQKKTEGAKELPYSVCLLFSSAKRDEPFHSRLVLASELLCVLFLLLPSAGRPLILKGLFSRRISIGKAK